MDYISRIVDYFGFFFELYIRSIQLNLVQRVSLPHVSVFSRTYNLSHSKLLFD